jgi:hypothetical protein
LNPSIEILKKIAEVLRVPVEQLISWGILWKFLLQ